MEMMTDEMKGPYFLQENVNPCAKHAEEAHRSMFHFSSSLEGGNATSSSIFFRDAWEAFSSMKYVTIL